MRKNILFLLTLLFSTVSMAMPSTPIKEGNRIVGHVVEKKTEENIPFASILILGTDIGATSNEEGKFEFANLKPGRYTLRVSAVGYVTQEKSVDVNKTYNAQLHFQMEEEKYEIEEVVVSANRNEVNRKDAPVVVNILSHKLFDMVNSTDLSKSLSYQSGIRVENNCQNCGFPQVRINGLDGPYSQILINSRPVISALSGVYGLEQIPTNMIERVEVVRGGGSALFGANAVGGTVNIITRDPISNSFQFGSTLSVTDKGSWEEVMMANASLVDKENNYGLVLYESYRNRSPYDRDDDGFSEIGKLKTNTFGLRAYYRPNYNSRLNVEYHTTQEFRRGGNKFDLQPHEADITEQTTHTINSGGVTYDRYWDEGKQKWQLFGSIQHTDRNSYYGAQRDPNAYGKTNDLTWVAGSMYVNQLGRCFFAPSTLTCGLEYQQNSLHDVMTGYHRDMEQEVRIVSAYVQNEWKIRKLSLLAGLRADKHNLISRLIVSPRLNLLYKASDNLQMRLTYSTGFRAPQAYDEDLHVTAVGGEGVQIVLANGLKEERSNSISGSLDWNFNLGHWQANLLFEGFYTALRNVFVLQDIGVNAEGFMIKERRNGDGARVGGVNIDAKVAHGKEAQLQLGFTAQCSRYTQDEVWTEADGHPLTVRRMPRTPNYYGYFTFSSAPFARFDFSLSGVYTGRMIVPHFAGYVEQDCMEKTPDFFDLNLKINYTFLLKEHINLQLNAGVQNLFNSFQKDLDRGEFRDAGYFYGPTQPRTIFFGFKISG